MFWITINGRPEGHLLMTHLREIVYAIFMYSLSQRGETFIILFFHFVLEFWVWFIFLPGSMPYIKIGTSCPKIYSK